MSETQEYTIGEAARELGISWSTLNTMIRRGKVAVARTVGGRRLLTKDAIDAYRREHKTTLTHWQERPSAPAVSPGLTVAEAAQKLDVSRQWIYQLIGSGQLDATRTQRGWIITEDAIARYRAEMPYTGRGRRHD